MIPDAVIAALRGGLSLMAASSDAHKTPFCVRVFGPVFAADRTRVTVFVPYLTGKRLLDDLASSPQLACVIVKLRDYYSVQLKGPVLAVREASEAERCALHATLEEFAEDAEHNGIPAPLVRRIPHWPCAAVEFQVSAVFQQTPGPRAGEPIAAHADPRTAVAALAPRFDVGPSHTPAPSERLTLKALSRCFDGYIPCAFATADADATPNVTFLSQLFYVDERHVALSRQFFRKTQANLEQNPQACVQVHDPATFDGYRLQLRHVRCERSGALFDLMSARIRAIASHCGMERIFELAGADVFEVSSVEAVHVAPDAPGTAQPHVSSHFERGLAVELRGLTAVSERVNRARNLEELLASALEALDEVLGFQHAMLFVPDDTGTRLVALASRGYGESGVGAEVPIGQGLIGTVATTRKPLRINTLGYELRYARSIRERVYEEGGGDSLRPEVPLPGLPDARSQLALPMSVGGELIGALAFESRSTLGFDQWQESFLQIVADHLAVCIARLREEEESDSRTSSAQSSLVAGSVEATALPAVGGAKHTFLFFRNDACVFVDGDYLVRNVPGKILWKLLQEHTRTARTHFTNRELRLDPTLGLPALRDNLESRLILLRKRLLEKCPDVRLVPTQRGRFMLQLEAPIELVEREHG